MVSAHISIIPEFREKLDLLGVTEHFTVNRDSIINNHTGSIILFRGLKTSSGNQEANLKSLTGVTTWVVDEAQELTDESKFEDIDLSIRANHTTNRTILILNPTTKDHWIYNRWFKGSSNYKKIEGFDVPISVAKNTCHIHTTYLDNIDNLSTKFIAALENIRDNDPSKYRHKILGGWLEKAEGVIFTNWIEGKFDNSLPYIYGMDFGYSVDPTALVKVAVDNKEKKVYLKQLLYKEGLSTDQIKDHLEQNTGKDELIIADSAEPRLINDLRLKGFNVNPCEKGPDSIRNGIMQMMDYEIIIDPDSHDLKFEANNYAWSDRKSNTPLDKHNHACFIGETLISTIDGQKQIKDIEIGDLVLTRKGYKKVLTVFDNGVKEVFTHRMLLDTEDVYLSCTSDHRIIHDNNQWGTRIEDIRKGVNLYQLSNSKVRYTTSIKEKDTLPKEEKNYIESFGSFIMESFLKIIMYIMLTVILPITISKILILYIKGYILSYQVNSDLKIIQINLKNSIQLELRRLKNGMLQRKERSGILNMLKKVIEGDVLLNTFASSAVKNMKPDIQESPNIVIKTVKLKRCVRVENWKERVYDLEIEDQHEYFANGILVHNCDAARYAFKHLAKGDIFSIV